MTHAARVLALAATSMIAICLNTIGQNTPAHAGSAPAMTLVGHPLVVTAGTDLVVDVRLDGQSNAPVFGIGVVAMSPDELADLVDSPASSDVPDLDLHDTVQAVHAERWDGAADAGGAVWRLTVPTDAGSNDSSSLSLPAPGAYAVVVTAGGNALITAIVVGAHDVPVAFGAYVDATLTLQPDGTSSIDPTVRTAVTHLTTLLEDTDVPFAVTVRPELLKGLTRSDVPGDAELVQRLGVALGGMDVLAAPYIALDPSAAAAAGLDEFFTAQLRTGEDTLGAVLGQFAHRVVWMAADPLTDDGVRLVRDLGAKVIVRLAGAGIPPPGGVASDDAAVADVFGTQQAAPVTVVLPDPIGDRLSVGSPDPVLAAYRLAASLVARHQDDAGAVVMVDLGTVDAGTIDALTKIVHDANGLLPSRVEDTVRAGEKPIEIGDSSGSVVPDLSVAARLRTELRSLAVATGEMLEQGDARGELWPELADAVLDAHFTDETRADYAQSLRALLTGIQSRVQLLAPATVNLGAHRTPVPITVKNDNEFPVTVGVRLTGAKLRLPPTSEAVSVPAHGSVQLRIPVDARTNGRFPVTAQLVTPTTGRQVGAPVTFSVRASALTGLGIVLTFAAVLVLLTWWAQHLRRQQRRRRGDATKDRHPVTSQLA